jgi:hypothetical protein
LRLRHRLLDGADAARKHLPLGARLLELVALIDQIHCVIDAVEEPRGKRTK